MVVAFVLFSALLHATWNAMLRVERDKDRALIAAVLTATVIAIVVAVVRCTITGEAPLPGWSAAWATLAGVFEWAYFYSLARALASGPLGTVYTISRGGSVVLVWPLSVVLFGEHITSAAALGSIVVLAGLGLSGLGDRRHDRDLDHELRGQQRRSIAWSIACAGSIAIYHLAYKGAEAEHGNPAAVFALALGLATAINVARVGRDGRRIVIDILRTRTWRVVLMGITCGGSFLILLEALAHGGAGFVLTLRNTSVLFAAGLAWLIGERPRVPQLVGAACVAAGATVMAWS